MKKKLLAALLAALLLLSGCQYSVVEDADEQQLLRGNAAIAEDHNITFREETDFSKVPAVVSNPDRVEQLLVILLDNAIKYTPGGGTVSLDATWDDARVTLIVKDTGIGISKEDLPYVFDRFYKVDKAHSGMGSGLGLSIARELLKWMGEDIWVKSEVGKGTQFGFTLRRDPTP